MEDSKPADTDVLMEDTSNNTRETIATEEPNTSETTQKNPTSPGHATQTPGQPETRSDNQTITEPTKDTTISAKRTSAEQSTDELTINPITKKLKLFNGDQPGGSDDDDDDDSDEDFLNKVRSNPSIPADSELLKKNEAWKTYTNYIQQQQAAAPLSSSALPTTITNTTTIPLASQNSSNSTAIANSLTSPASASNMQLAAQVQGAGSSGASTAVMNASAALGLSNQLSSIPLNIPAPDYLPANIQLLINTLPALDNLATQILRVIVQDPYQKILDLVANSDTLAGMTYQTLINLFDNIKNMYSSEDPFISVEHVTFGLWKEGSQAPIFLRGKEDTVISTLRKVNLATFANATLGTIDTGFFYLNESFMDVFCPDQILNPNQTISFAMPSNSGSFMTTPSPLPTKTTGKDFTSESSGSSTMAAGKLLKSQTILYLELKTQAYISALEAHERSREDILNDIFPDNLQELLLERKKAKSDHYHHGSDSTASSNSTIPVELTASELDFVKRCQKRKENLLRSEAGQELSEQYDWLIFLKDFFEFMRKNIGYLIWGSKNIAPDLKRLKLEQQQYAQSRSRSTINQATSSVGNSGNNNRNNNGNSSGTATGSGVVTIDNNNQSELMTGPSDFKFDPNSLPSDIVMYHRENRFGNSNNNSNRQSGRRLWTKAEEAALKEGLQLRGPQWAQILELYGAGGTVSEALKNRTQVQLKDKARNWKLFFLKNSLPLPEYLKKVTGDLDLKSAGGKGKAKKLQDEKKNSVSKPPRIEQKHVDAANAQVESESAANLQATAQSTQPDVSEHVAVPEQSTKPSQHTSVPSTATDLQPSSEQQATSSISDQEEKQSLSASTENANYFAQHDAVEEARGTNSGAAKADNDKGGEEDEVPDYDNILKNLIDEATNKSDKESEKSPPSQPEPSQKQQGQREDHQNNEEAAEEDESSSKIDEVHDDVQRLVNEVINANTANEQK